MFSHFIIFGWTTFLLPIMLARYFETPYDLIIITYFDFLYTVFMAAVKGGGKLQHPIIRRLLY